MKEIFRCATILVVPFALSGCIALFGGGAAAGAGVAAGIDAAEHKAAGPNATDTLIGAAVMVTFATPTDVNAVRSNEKQYASVLVQGKARDSVRTQAVTTLVGRIAARDGNAMLLRITETNGIAGRKSFDGKYVAVVSSDANADVRVLSIRPERPHRVVLGAIAGVFLGGLLLAYLLFSGEST